MYLFKVYNGNLRTKFEIYSKFTVTTLDWRSRVHTFIVLEFLLLNLNKQKSAEFESSSKESSPSLSY